MKRLDVSQIRNDFPILARQVNGHPLVYLDNAATTQKPRQMMMAITDYYQQHNANVHRGVHTLSDESTQEWERARARIATFFDATPDELVITRNSTEAINILAHMVGPRLTASDTVVVTMLDHHSNLVPWQRAARAAGAEWLVLPVNEVGELDLDATKAQLFAQKDQLRVLSVPLISNVLGAVVPVVTISGWLREWGVRERVLVVVDAAQAVARQHVSLATLDADAFVWSGHKIYGPMGIGGLVIRRDLLLEPEPVLVGGGMVDTVTPTHTTYIESLSERFTAGTPDVASLVGMAASLEWLSQFSWEDIHTHEHTLIEYAYEQLSALPEVTLVGPPAAQRAGSVSWLYEGVHAHELAQVLDHQGIAVRSGHHCAMPLHTHFDWPATTRASFAIYNTKAEIDALVDAMRQAKKVLV